MAKDKPFTADEFKERLTTLVYQELEKIDVSDPDRLATALINAIAETWAENNRRLEDYIRRISYGAGGRIY